MKPICCCHFLHIPVGLGNVSTADLVAELVKREGVGYFDIKSTDVFYDLHFELPNDEMVIYGNCWDEGYGPAKIVVVRE